MIFDRALYWGTRRENGHTAQTFPYRCSCGGHTFEIALGFEYLPEALDENDIETITAAVRLLQEQEQTEDARVVEGIRQGLDDMRAGRGRPAREVFADIRREFSLPPDT
jgi:hypothetical protein